jgi:hypothetical protein
MGEDAAAELAEFLASLIRITGALNGLIAQAVADLVPTAEDESAEPFEEIRRGAQAIHRELRALQARLDQRWPEAAH